MHNMHNLYNIPNMHNMHNMQNMPNMMKLQLMGIIQTKGTCRRCKDRMGGKVQVKYKEPYVLVVQSLRLQNQHPSEHCVGKLQPQFEEVCHADHYTIQTTII